MKISELKAGQGKVDVEGIIKSKAEPRAFNKFGKDLRVANAVLSNDSGEIAMSLWNDDVDKVNVGDRVRVTNGYVSEFNGIKQLTSGKYGKLDIVGDEKSGDNEGEHKKGKKVEEIEEQEF